MTPILFILLYCGLKTSVILKNYLIADYIVFLSLIMMLASIFFCKRKFSSVLMYSCWFLLSLSYGSIQLNSNPMFYKLDIKKGSTAEITAKITSHPKFKYRKLQCFIELKTVKFNKNICKTRQNLFLEIHSSIPFKNLSYGSIIRFSGIISPLNEKNKFDLFLKNRRVFGKVAAKKIIYTRRPNFVITVSDKIKSFVKNSFHKNEKLDYLSKSIIFALIFGEKHDLPKELKNLFINMNVYHIFAVSGLHFGIIAFIIFKILKFFNIKTPNCHILTIPFLFFFLVIINFPPSAFRAFIMIFLYLLAPLIGRQVKSLNILFVTAILLLLFHPKWHNDIGFILSFTAMFSLLSMGKELDKLLSKKFERIKEKYKINPYAIKLSIWGHKIIITISYTLCAWLGTAPLIATYFKIVTPVSILTNLLAILFIPFIIQFIFISITLGMLGSIFLKAYSSFAAILIHSLIYFLNAIESVPYSYLKNIKFSETHMFFYYVSFLTLYFILISINKKLIVQR